MSKKEAGHLRNLSGRLVKQFSWALAGQLIAAVLQMGIFLLLARQLSPEEFGVVSVVYAVMQTAVTLNGFGLQREIRVVRSRGPSDSRLPQLFSRLLAFSYGIGAVGFVVVGLCVALIDGSFWIALLPLCARVPLEQITLAWNGIYNADDRNQLVVVSQAVRRVPVVVGLLVGGVADWSTVPTWSASLTVGASLTYAFGYPFQEKWARSWRPSLRKLGNDPLPLRFWFAQVGTQLREHDVTLLVILSPSIGGVYALAKRVVKPLTLITRTSVMVAFPRMARMGEVRPQRVAVWLAIALAPAAMGCLVISGLASLIPDFLGSEYEGAIGTLRILSLAIVFWSAGFFIMMFMQARDRQSAIWAGRMSLMMSLPHLTLVGLGATWQATGAAWGAVVGELALVVLLLIVLATLYADKLEAVPAVPDAPRRAQEVR